MPARGPSQPAALIHLAVSGYRSLQQLTLPLGGLTLVCGVNGCGKSNLYRSLGLISAAARGDLAAAVQTILEIGDRDGLQGAIADAFPGCRLAADTSQPLFRLQLHQPGLMRPLEASELSDGTLRYLLLAAALFSPRLPPLLVLNEPQNSLHPELLAPLARLIGAAAERTQIWVVAHAEALIEALTSNPGCRLLRLERQQGATTLPGQTVLERAAWRWPARGRGGLP